MRVKERSLVAPFAAALLLLAGSARAQTSGATDVPDHFRIELGGFRIGSDTELGFNQSGEAAPPVDFESLDLPKNSTRGYVEAFFRPWRRHEFSASWYRFNREGDPKSVERDFTWGSDVIHAGASVTAHSDSNYFSGAYRFAAYKNDRFEIGPALGIGHLSLEAGIRGQGSVTGPGGTQSRSFDTTKSLGQITGDIGGYFHYWPARRLHLRGDLRYIIVKPGDSEASITDGRAAVLYYIVPHFGVGLQYTYTKFRYDREVASTELGGSLRYSGGQLVVSGTF